MTAHGGWLDDVDVRVEGQLELPEVADEPPTGGDPRCGTTAGYQAHRRTGTPYCEPCRDAQAAWMRRYRARMYLAGGPLLVDATGTRRRLQALARIGWTYEAVATELALTRSTVQAWTTSPRVSRATAARVARLYDAWWNAPGPSALRAARARAAGWPPPLAWDDDTIDDPAATPHLVGAEDVVEDQVDDVAVQLVLDGHRLLLTGATLTAAVRALLERGRTVPEVAERLGVDRNTVLAIVARARRAAA